MSQTPRTDAERARIEHDLPAEGCWVSRSDVLYVLNQMEDHAAALERENTRLRAALAPFAALHLWPHDLGEEMDALIRNDPDWNEQENEDTRIDMWVRRGDVRAARLALKGGTDDTNETI